MVDVAIASFGTKDHVGFDPRHGLIRTWAVTSAAAHDGARLAAFLDRGKSLMGLVVRTIGLPGPT